MTLERVIWGTVLALYQFVVMVEWSVYKCKGDTGEGNEDIHTMNVKKH